MDLKEINKKLEKIKLDKETKESILDLIDAKTNNDMEKAISRFETSIHKIETSIGALNNKLDVSISSIKWTLITVCTVTAAVVGIIINFFK